MRGSVRKRGTTWTWYLDAPPDPVTGKRRQASKGGFRTKRELSRRSTRRLPACATAPSSNPPSSPLGASCWRSGFRRSGRPGSGRRLGRATG
jgi:hypothetical protein